MFMLFFTTSQKVIALKQLYAILEYITARIVNGNRVPHFRGSKVTSHSVF